jgi:hypothetical protein
MLQATTSLGHDDLHVHWGSAALENRRYVLGKA